MAGLSLTLAACVAPVKVKRAGAVSLAWEASQGWEPSTRGEQWGRWDLWLAFRKPEK